MNRDFCITFAGPVACSKSPVAHRISMAFNWPIFSHDAIRHELMEDTLESDVDDEVLERLIVQRIRKWVERGGSIVYDASQDRNWERFVVSFERTPPYTIGVISFDLSKDFYKKILKAKGYDTTASRAGQLLEEHSAFVEQHKDAIICSITDENFHDRLRVAEEAVLKFISDKTFVIE